MKIVSIQLEGNHYIITEGGRAVDGPYSNLKMAMVYALERALQASADFRLDFETLAELAETGGLSELAKEVL